MKQKKQLRLIDGIAVIFLGLFTCGSASAHEVPSPDANPAKGTVDKFISYSGKACDGHAVSIPDPGSNATVVIFLQVDCPISNRYSPEINRLAQKFGGQVEFVGVYCDKDVESAAAAKHGRDFGYKFPLMLDHGKILPEMIGATTTPEVAVLNLDGKLIYRGRIDNMYEKVGVVRSQVTEHDLEDTLSQLASGKKPAPRFTQPLGCSIP